jgi:hypothetical protein
MSKKLGILDYQSRLSRDKKMNLLRENILSGKQAEKEMKEYVRQQINSQEDEKESIIIAHLAEFISKTKNISADDALLEARMQYKKEHRNN